MRVQPELATVPAMPAGDEDDPIAEDVSAARASSRSDPAAALAAGGGGGDGKPKLSKEQIAAVSADIAAVTKTMQEQLAAISQEVNALKGQIDGGAVRPSVPPPRPFVSFAGEHLFLSDPLFSGWTRRH
eukprot:COSAG02_NODE_131_length_34710_cov_17.171159_36_plen_129_part_00